MGNAILASLLLSVAAGGDAQTYTLNTQDFSIPIQIEPARRKDIKELELYSSADEGRTWEKVAAAPPDKESFPYRANRGDSTYWFTLVTKFNDGNREPADQTKMAPTMKIVVDTLKPLMRIVSANWVGEEVAVAWEIQEDHPDFSNFKLEYKPSEPLGASWQPVSANPATVGQARFRPASNGPLSLKLTLQDTAGNISVATGEINATVASKPVQPPTPPSIPAPPPNSWETPQLPRTSQQASFVQPQPPPPMVDLRGQFASQNYTTAQPTYQSNSLTRGVVAASPGMGASTTPLVQQGGAAHAPGQPPFKLINTTRLSFNCAVRVVGSSGIGTLELWYTADDGHTWKPLAEQTDAKLPISADLPGEGIYGFRLVAKSKAGLSKGPPQPNDPPEFRVEVDLTAPQSELYKPQCDPNRRDTVLLTWNATDRSLAPNPITLEWAERRAGPWQVIAADLANTGQHPWKPTTAMPSSVYLRLTTRDMAGNVSTAETADPVLLDIVEPEAALTSVVARERN